MLAKNLIASGVHDIFVCWVTDDEPWCIGKEYFYFHPKHLKLEFFQGNERFTTGSKLPKLWIKLIPNIDYEFFWMKLKIFL